MIGTGELVVILLVILILFGGKKLPEFAENLGKGVRAFKKACDGSFEDKTSCESCACHDKEKKESHEEHKNS